MRMRSFLILAIVLCPLFAVCGDLAHTVKWQAEGKGGFSAPNWLLDEQSDATGGIVVCERDVGVVCISAEGERLWEYALEPPATAAPAVADVDGDGKEDIVAADGVGNLVVLTRDGDLIWEATMPGGVVADSCPAVADLDGNGKPEVLVGDTSGMLSCFSDKGKLRWSFKGDGTQMGPVLVADLYDAPGKEIVVTSHDRHIYALNAEGEWLWDLFRENDLFPNSTPILADVDGTPDLYIGGGLHHFYRIDLATHQIAFEENVYLHVNGAITASDLDGDGRDEVLFGNKGGAFWCYGANGFKWTREFRHSSLYAAPLILNLDDDEALEIIAYSVTGDLWVLDANGDELSTANTGCKAVATPIAGDFDGDGRLDIVATSLGGMHGNAAMVFLEFDAPFKPDPRNRLVFAGNRAHTGQAECRPNDSPLPTPPLNTAQGGATTGLNNESALLSGTNTWRFNVKNPEQERLVLLTDIAYPDGSVRHFANHAYGPVERPGISFDIDERGSYDVSSRLVRSDSLETLNERRTTLKFRGIKSDVSYLTSLFDEIDEKTAEWNPSNPKAARAFEDECFRLRGMLTELRNVESEQRAERLTPLRRSTERTRALVTAGQRLAPTGSFCVWESNPWAYFDGRDSLPTPADRTERLAASLCIGEYESLAVNVTNLTDRTLDVRVSCRSEADGVSPSVEFRRAATVPTLRRERVADALPPLKQADMLTISPFESQQLWITVSAPGATPGAYLLQLSLKSIEADPTEILLPLEVTVHDLALPRPRPLRFCQWSYDGGDLGQDNPEALKDLVEHGVTILFGKSPSASCDADGNLTEIDFAAHDESVTRLAPHGMAMFVGSQGSLRGQPFLSAPWRKGFMAYLRAWVAHMSELGLDYEDWALYPYDEPSTPFTETTLNLVEVAKVIREADPNILIYTDPTSGTTMETVEMLKDLIDIWCPSEELLERLGPELVPVAKEVGKEVWMYDAAGRAKTLSCLGLYRWRFWYAWNQGFTGVGWWCYSNHGPDRWDGPNDMGDFYATVYDGPGNTVFPSKRWEVAREGIEDYEYLWLLREAIREAEERGVAGAKVKNAKSLLAELPLEIERVLHQAGRRLPLTPDSVPLYDEVFGTLQDARGRIVAACLELRSAIP